MKLFHLPEGKKFELPRKSLTNSRSREIDREKHKIHFKRAYKDKYRKGNVAVIILFILLMLVLFLINTFN